MAEKLAAKHAVAPDEVEEVLLGLSRQPLRFRTGRDGSYEAYGRTESGRYLFVVFVFRSDHLVWPITAYEMTRQQRRFYNQGGSQR